MKAVRRQTVPSFPVHSTVFDDDVINKNYAASKYLVTFMRMVTSTQIQGEPETYEPFLTHPDTGETMGVKDFCRIVVEVLGKEAGEHSSLLFQVLAACFVGVADIEVAFFTDHVQLTALSQALKVNLKIAYLDGRSQDGHVEFVSFNYASDENETPLTLIYRWAIDLSCLVLVSLTRFWDAP